MVVVAGTEYGKTGAMQQLSIVSAHFGKDHTPSVCVYGIGSLRDLCVKLIVRQST